MDKAWIGAAALLALALTGTLTAQGATARQPAREFGVVQPAALFPGILKQEGGETGQILEDFMGHGAGVRAVAFSPDGATVLTGSDDEAAKLWSIFTGEQLLTFSGHTSVVSSVAFSPDGQQIATGSWDRTAKIWDVDSGQELLSITGHSSLVSSVAFSPDGAYLLTASVDDTAQLWDVETGALVRVFAGHLGDVRAADYAPNGDEVLTGSWDGTAKTWDTETGNATSTFGGHTAFVTSVQFSSEGSQVITGSYDRTAKLWDRSTGALLQTFEGHISGVRAVALSPDGTQALTGSFDGTAKLWNTADAALVTSFDAHEGSVAAVAFSANGKVLLTGSSDGTAKLWTLVEDLIAPELSLLGGNPLTINCGGAFNDPGALAIDDVDGDISAGVQLDVGPLDLAAPGTYEIEYSITDIAGNGPVTATRTIVVLDNCLPVLTLLGNNPLTIACSTPFVEPGFTATDAGDGDLTAQVTVDDGGLDTSVPGTYVRTYGVRDSNGNLVSVTRSVIVEDNCGPTLTLFGGQTFFVNCNTDYVEPGFSAFDTADGDVTSKVTVTGDVIDVDSPGSYTLNYEVIDEDGNAATVSRQVIVSDNCAPSIFLFGANPQTVNCVFEYVEPGFSASDVADGDLTANVNVDASAVDVATPGQYSVTYSVLDSNENLTMVERTVVVTQNCDPTLTLFGSNPLTLSCNTDYVEPGFFAADVLGTDLTSLVVVDDGGLNPDAPGDYTFTYTVSDTIQETTTVKTRTVTVSDNCNPTILLFGANPLNLNCNSTFQDPGFTAFDAADGNLNSLTTVDNGGLDTAVPGTYTITYSVSDSDELSALVTRTVLVADNCVVEVQPEFDPELQGRWIGDRETGFIVLEFEENRFQVVVEENVDGVKQTTEPVLSFSGSFRTFPDLERIELIVTEVDGAPLAEQILLPEGAYAVTGENLTFCATFGVLPGADKLISDALVVSGTADCAALGFPVFERDNSFQSCAALCVNQTADSDGDGLTNCIESCIGTDPAKVDSDEDGLPDAFEFNFGLNPLVPGGPLDDLDQDGLTNPEEFRGGSDPSDSNDPNRTVFVSPTGSDQVGNGSAVAPYATIAFALEQHTVSALDPLRLSLAPGTYPEDVVLQPGLSLNGRAATRDLVIINGLLQGAHGATLADLSIYSPGIESAILLDTTGSDMHVVNVVFDGQNHFGVIGIAAAGVITRGAVIERCIFRNLDTGIRIDGVFPLVRRNQFTAISRAGVEITANAVVDEGATLGDENDPETGFNAFDFDPNGSARAIINNSGTTVGVRSNGWSTQDETEIDALIDGDGDFGNFFNLQSAILAASLFVTVWNGVDQERIVDAQVTLTPSAFSTITSNVDGVYAFPSVVGDTYSLSAVAPGFARRTMQVTVADGQLASVVLPLFEGAPPKGLFCGMPQNGGAAGTGDAAAVLLVLALLLAWPAHRRSRL
ncbi:MAG: DUF5011 domain-containing protein [Candidatus Hydrogenedentes bacterium]|nr:DUF5011 domain-containing protein [Candidatus Hydrogenedentota bacterium]